MKRLRKGILLTLLALCVAMGVMVAGCGKKETVTISFELNGGDAQAFQPMEAVVGEDIILQIPKREGYEFTGWYDNQSLTGTPFMGGSLKAPETDTIYYASWAQLYKVSLNANGGKFSDGTDTKEVYIAKGKGLQDALSEYLPTYGNMQFGAWFSGDTEITEDYKMPGREIILNAKYSVGYSVEIYKQTSSDGYEHDASADFTGMGFFDDDCSITVPTIAGFEFFRNHPGCIATLKLKEDSTQNVFKLYYNKSAYTIIYNANAPETASFSGYMADQKILHGEKGYALECGFAIRAHRFAGWAKSAGGEVEYKVGDELPEGNYTLYAVWDEGYSDLFGGTDFIFFPHEGRDGTAILQRGNAEIQGTTNKLTDNGYEADRDGMYVVFTDNLIAKLVDSTPKAFSFLDKDMEGEYSYRNAYYEETPKESDWKLELDGFDTAKLTRNGTTTEYSFSLDAETGYYKIEKGKERGYLVLGKQGDEKVFTLVGSERGSFMQFSRISVMNYGPGDHTLTLDGLGNATWIYTALSTSVRGRYEAPVQKGNFDTVKVHLDNGEDMEFMFLSFETLTAVLLNNYSGTYKPENGEGADLVLDGFEGYTGEARFEGKDLTYFIEDNVLGTMVNILDNYTVTKKFRLDTEKMTYTEVSENYVIYRYLYSDQGANNVGNYYLVIYDEEKDGVKQASLMRFDGTKGTELYKGTVKKSEVQPLSEFKATNTSTSRDKNFPYTEFKFFGSEKFTIGPLFYLYTDEDPKTEELEATYMYMNERGSGRKLLVYTGLNTYEGYGLEGIGSFLIEENGSFLEGSLDSILPTEKSMADCKEFFGPTNYYSFSYYSQTGTLDKRYFAIYQDGDDVATAKYEIKEVKDQPMGLAETYGEMPEDSQYPFSMEISLFLNGEGEARYLMQTGAGSEYIKGTYTSLGIVNANGLKGYRITFTDDRFPDLKGQEIEFVISGLNSLYYHLHNKIMEGRNEIENGGYVELDGWGTHAKYVDNFGHEYEGYYSFYYGRGMMVIYSDMNTGVAQVPIRDGKFINTPPETKSQWRLVDQNFEEYYKHDAVAIFDGEGGVTVEDWPSYMNWSINGGDSNTWGYERKIYGKGYYTALSEFEYELSVGFYNDNGDLEKTETWIAKLDQGCCVKMEKGAVGSYVQDSDKAVIYLGGYGTAFYVDGRGNRQDGNYLFVDDGIGMFINETESYMLSFNSENGVRTFKLLNDPSKFKTFYADDFSAIEFNYTLRVDGQEIGLWYLDDNGDFVFYEFTETEGFKRTDSYHYETGDTYENTVDGKKKTYKLWTGSEKIELNGEIIFRAIDEKGKDNSRIKDAKLSFTPDGTTGLNADATLTFKDFRTGSEEKSYEGKYSVKMIGKDTIYDQNIYVTYHLYLCYGDMEFTLLANRADKTFQLWANINASGIASDISVLVGDTTIAAAEISTGTGYTLGVMTWDLADWQISNDMLLGGYSKACDENEDMICFEVLWADYEGKMDKIIGYTTSTGINGDIPIYEIFTKNLRGDHESIVLLATLSVGSAIYYVQYATCEWVEVTVNLPTENKGTKATDEYRVFEERVIATTKGFASGDIAYLHVYKRTDDTSKEDPRVKGFESISTGYAMYLLNVDMLLVENKELKAGSRVLVVTPNFVSKNNWDYNNVTLWFGVNQHILASNTDKKDDKNFNGVSFDIIFLTNVYRGKDETGPDNRTVLDGWLVFYYIADENNKDISYTFLFGYGDDGKTRISRLTCQDRVTTYDLTFSGTISDPKITFTPYTPPVEEDKDKGE